jgi:hypothetical protein
MGRNALGRETYNACATKRTHACRSWFREENAIQPRCLAGAGTPELACSVPRHRRRAETMLAPASVWPAGAFGTARGTTRLEMRRHPAQVQT